jgi:hypothetical protein
MTLAKHNRGQSLVDCIDEKTKAPIQARPSMASHQNHFYARAGILV